MKLNVGEGLALPLDWMTLATVVYGARGSGKTTLGSVIAEEVTKAKQRFCAIDLKGDWYGLKSTADGKGDGIPVVVFGGDHQDVPLEDGSGSFIGETIANLEQPAIIDLEYFSKGKQIRFLAQFFETLYDRNREPLLLLMDEAQRYAPQKPIDPESAKCLGAVEDLVKLGRKHGIGPMLFTQRGSGLNKEVSELCDMMVAFRTPGPLDQDRVKGWLEANTTKQQMLDVMGSLSGLPTGTAIFASGHPDLKIFGTYAVRRRETFDSSATPKVGQRKIEPKKLAKPDLEQLRTRMAAAIDRAKADDPKELRKAIAALRTELEQERKKQPTPAKTETKTVTKYALKDGQLARAEKILMRGSELAARLHQESLLRAKLVMDDVTKLDTVLKPIADAIASTKVAPSAPPPTVDPRSRSAGSNGGGAVRATRPEYVRASEGSRPSADSETKRASAARTPERAEGITAPQQRILDALAALEAIGVQNGHKTQVALFAQASPTSSSYANNLGALRSAGLIDYPAGSLVRLTDVGRAIANADAAPRTTDDLHDYLRRMLSNPQWRIVDALVRAYPDALTKENLAERAEASVSSSSFANNLGALRSLGLIDYPAPGQIIARSLLFLEERVA